METCPIVCPLASNALRVCDVATEEGDAGG